MHMSNLIASAIITAATLPAVSQAGPAPLPGYTSEKCYGVAAAGANDCGTQTHSCAGTASRAKDGASWVYVPAGTCKKIDGGSLAPKS
jgi:uncharacterized membrane protein